MNELDIYFKRYKKRYLFAMPKLKKLDVVRPYLKDLLQRGAAEGSVCTSRDIAELTELIIATYTGLFHHFNFKYLQESRKRRENDIRMLDIYIDGLKRCLRPAL